MLEEKKTLLPGDIIICQGKKVVVKEVSHCEYWGKISETNKEGGFRAEFTDTNGIYRSWVQYLDGGNVYREENGRKICL